MLKIRSFPKTVIYLVAAWKIGIAVCASGILHVDASKPDDTGPGTEWNNAFQTIQAAVNAAAPGDTILVTNGIYDIGGQIFGAELLTNRVSIWQAVHVTAVSTNPSDTVIAGAPDPGTGGRGSAAIRGVYMVANATLSGFTVTNGHSLTGVSLGGGIRAANSTAIISNCTITGNHAERGGGVYGGTYYDCELTGNQAAHVNVNTYGGGASHAVFYRCLFQANHAYNGGGVSFSTLHECEVFTNTAHQNTGFTEITAFDCVFRGNNGNNSSLYRSEISGYSGAIGANYYESCRIFNIINPGWDSLTLSGTFVNCLIYDNIGGSYAGVPLFGGTPSIIVNCTIVNNATRPGTTYPGGVVPTEGSWASATVRAYVTNSIVYHNRARDDFPGAFPDGSPDFAITAGNHPGISYTCTSFTNGLTGSGNTTNVPLLVNVQSNNFMLLRLSPCVDAGTQMADPSTGIAITNDIVGVERPRDGTGDGQALFDIGAYEYILPAKGTLFYSQ